MLTISILDNIIKVRNIVCRYLGHNKEDLYYRCLKAGSDLVIKYENAVTKSGLEG